MLPPFIIEQIRQREEEERLRDRSQQPHLELPVDLYWPQGETGTDEQDAERGVAILDFG